MLIREAIRLAQSAHFDGSKVPLICFFEPSYLKIYLQAYLVERFPTGTPEVVTFGYDQLTAGLVQTSSVFKTSPTLLFLSWEDIHPSLSWRSRGPFGKVGIQEISDGGELLKMKLLQWVTSRDGAETYIAMPPEEWLPLHDSCSSLGLGRTALEASALIKEIVRKLAMCGARVLRLHALPLSFRDFLQAGCPLSAEACEMVARQFVTLAFPLLERKKVLITDLDGTLWSGIIGEDGAKGISCGQEPRGWPFHVFQKFLLKLKDEGILLAFCSKNNEGDVLPLFDSLEAPLKLSDFSTYRCNWEPKSSNIRSIAEELNVGCDALVVIDDDEVELAEIRRGVPEAVLMTTPREGQAWAELLSRLQDLFCTWRVSKEDRIRTDSVLREHLRKAQHGWQGQGPGNELQALEYLRDMQLELTVCPHAFPDPRSLELINKTNQFNLTGERITQEDWRQWAATPGTFCLSAKLKDRFGDFGTICVITGRAQNDYGEVFIRQFVLSCRAFGRGVEIMILGELAKLATWDTLYGNFRKTNRNVPAERFLVMLGGDISNGRWRLSRNVIEKAVIKFRDETAAKVILE